MTPTNEAGHGLPELPATLSDDFKGDDAKLIESAKSLIYLSDRGAMVPHGIGGHARTIMSAFIVRMESALALSRGVPADMVLVPREPTEAMIEAGHAAYEKALIGNRRNISAAFRARWLAMIKAAPAAAGAQGEVEAGASVSERAREAWEDFVGCHLGDDEGEASLQTSGLCRMAFDAGMRASSEPSIEDAIVALVSALQRGKGWMRDYADAIVRDAIDRRGLDEQALTQQGAAKDRPDTGGHALPGDDCPLCKAVGGLTDLRHGDGGHKRIHCAKCGKGSFGLHPLPFTCAPTAALSSHRQAGDERPLGYTALFNAIAAATWPATEGVAINVSVAKFHESIGGNVYTAPPPGAEDSPK